MALNKDKIRLDKIWLRVKRDTRASARIDTLPREVSRELGALKEKLLEGQCGALRARLVRERQDLEQVVAGRDTQLDELREQLAQKERAFEALRAELEARHTAEIEQLRDECQSLTVKQKESAIQRSLHQKEIALYRGSLQEQRDKHAAERLLLEQERARWREQEKRIEGEVFRREEELCILREQLVEKENRFYHQQAQTEGELELLRKELARLRNLLTLEQSSNGTALDDAQEGVRQMEEKLEKFNQQMHYEQELKKVDRSSLQGYRDEVSRLTNERARLIAQFDQERVRWKELWARERSSWERRKQELREWEDRLRYERERFVTLAWDGRVPVPHYDAGRKNAVGSLPRPPKPFFVAIVDKRAWRQWLEQAGYVAARALRSGRVYAAVISAIVLVWGGLYLSAILRAPKEVFFPERDPRAVCVREGMIYLAMGSDGTLSVMRTDAPGVAVRELRMPEGVTGFIIEGGFLWSIDASRQAVVLRELTRPDKVLGHYPLAQPADYIAADGQGLWTLDVGSRKLVRYAPHNKMQVVRQFELVDINPGPMMFMDRRLWVVDKNTGSFVEYAVGAEALARKRRISLPVIDGRRTVPSAVSEDEGMLWLTYARSGLLYSLTRARLSWQPFFQ